MDTVATQVMQLVSGPIALLMIIAGFIGAGIIYFLGRNFEVAFITLSALAVGGVYVGGGIAPKIRPKLEDGRFVAAFRDKGRFASLMAGIPVALALDPRAPLLGAAEVARELAQTGRA